MAIPVKKKTRGHVTQVCEAHNWVILSFLQQVQEGARPTTQGSRENIGHNVHVWGDRERNTRSYSVKAGARRTIVDLRMVNWELGSKTPTQSPEDGHIYCVVLIRIAFCHVSKNLPLHCLIYLFFVTMNIFFFRYCT